MDNDNYTSDSELAPGNSSSDSDSDSSSDSEDSEIGKRKNESRIQPPAGPSWAMAKAIAGSSSSSSAQRVESMVAGLNTVTDSNSNVVTVETASGPKGAKVETLTNKNLKAVTATEKLNENKTNRQPTEFKFTS